MTKCLEIIQALESKGQTFSLKITSGKFSFSLDTRGSKEEHRRKKKLSPSQQKRNLKRKEEFLKQKSESSQKNLNTVTEESETEVDARKSNSFKCSLCEKTFNTEHDLKIHRG